MVMVMIHRLTNQSQTSKNNTFQTTNQIASKYISQPVNQPISQSYAFKKYIPQTTNHIPSKNIHRMLHSDWLYKSAPSVDNHIHRSWLDA